MTVATYPDSMTMREARDRYFEVNGFGADGGYEDAWVDFKFFALPFPIPNIEGRRRAVKLHDFHHVLTGYDVDTTGELEIAGYEMGAGCGHFWVGWGLSLPGIAGGALVAPLRTFRAFVRGRRAQTLYTRDYDERYVELLDRTVGEMRRETKLDGESPVARAADAAMFAAYVALGAIILVPFVIAIAPVVPIGVVALRLKKQRDAARTRGSLRRSSPPSRAASFSPWQSAAREVASREQSYVAPPGSDPLLR